MDGFDQGRRWHHVHTEESMRDIAATTTEFRRILATR
jgi:hypothetical protein